MDGKRNSGETGDHLLPNLLRIISFFFSGNYIMVIYCEFSGQSNAYVRGVD